MVSIYHGNIKLFSGNGNVELAKEVALNLGIKLGQCEIGKFSDGETNVKINETVREADVFIIQPTSAPVNDNLMELLIMIDAMKRASACRINAIIPYYGYARQDRKARARDPISAKLIANLITTAGADRVISMDLHCAQIQGFFDIPVDHIHGNSMIVNYYEEKFKNNKESLIAVSPDLGSVTRTRSFAEKLEVPIAIIDKRRPKPNVSEVMNIIGDVKDKNVILVDDMIDTAGTITNAANALKEYGAKDVFACCTHAVLSGDAINRIEKSAIKELIVLNTLKLPQDKKIDKIKQLSIAHIIAKAIKCVNEGHPVSTIF